MALQIEVCKALNKTRGLYRRWLELQDDTDVLTKDELEWTALCCLRLHSFGNIQHQNEHVDNLRASDDCLYQGGMSRTVHKGELQNFTPRAFLSHVLWNFSLKRAESQVNGYSSFSRLGVLVETCCASNGAQRLGQRSFARVYMTQNSNV
ncbi:UNVERIFIED_CONTAM: hypothetical protein B566_EDAN019006 [Ephemera danica]|nr:hypothetical protein B566_EDAN019006 [Ephemera danica]